ncbi:aldose 1-epimerase family protein [Gleimia hominis]|uniref:Aldose 1-epimerase family protein n=1 Tax=Gleimia hominis TaxID=595468 RepID=A0ABU3IBD3_9ACTO|nr:aldose 1-epimerase family protein [Gleimia hominis]MDT3766520.1 aldose 1-epimerase family protein [Gleimia hominis]
MLQIPIYKEAFSNEPQVFLKNDGFKVEGKRYRTGIESLTLGNERGYVEVLPFMGQIIWDANFDGHSLRMKNMFEEPHPAKEITDTYGCFAFHSGILSAGCPSPEDTHQMHGEFPCAPMDRCWLEVSENGDAISAVSSYEYVKGFGDHYRARPSVTLHADSGLFDIGLSVTNLSEYMPLSMQYMCHMNYAFVENGKLDQSIGKGAFQLRRSIPAHVKPTKEWTQLNEDIISGKVDADDLSAAEGFDPEIVYFADDLPQYGEDMKFTMTSPDGTVFTTQFKSSDFQVATRWILYNPDQQVAAFVLPGTSRPEGFLAAEKAGTIVKVDPGATRTFAVTTGVEG